MSSGSAISQRITVVIPARMASSRYPGKPLVVIDGLPMVEHVRRRALLAAGLHRVVVATCDKEIADAVESFGGEAVMTRDTHERCTDRVEEAMHHVDGDVVVMVQGDEPLLRPEAVVEVAEPLLRDDALQCVNLLSPLEIPRDLENPDIVKAVCDRQGDVMFFSRAAVPFFRSQVTVPVYRQTGIMAFRNAFLRTFSTLSETPFERAEAVDMLRVIEHGYPIRGVIADYGTQGVDRPNEVAIIETLLREDPVQRAIHERIQSESSSRPNPGGAA